jgi:hypothetical protein
LVLVHSFSFLFSSSSFDHSSLSGARIAAGVLGACNIAGNQAVAPTDAQFAVCVLQGTSVKYALEWICFAIAIFYYVSVFTILFISCFPSRISFNNLCFCIFVASSFFPSLPLSCCVNSLPRPAATGTVGLVRIAELTGPLIQVQARVVPGDKLEHGFHAHAFGDMTDITGRQMMMMDGLFPCFVVSFILCFSFLHTVIFIFISSDYAVY